MNLKPLITFTAAWSLLAISGCDIEKTEDGEMPDIDFSGDAGQVPQYDVDVRQTREGRLPDVDVDVDSGKLPEYDVDGPDVNIGTKETTIKVPDVDVSMEEKKVTVPDVDVEMPNDDEPQ